MFNNTASTATIFTANPNSAPTIAPDYAPSTDPFEARFGQGNRLPRGLREEAAGMSWRLFTATYAPSADIRITNLKAEPLRDGKFEFTAEAKTFSKTEAPRTTEHTITTTGPVSACSAILNEHGRYVEILTFRQHYIYEATVTFVQVAHKHDHRRNAWAVGFGPDSHSSAAAALSSGAQRIYS